MHHPAKRDGPKPIGLTKPTLSLCVPEEEQNVSGIFLCPVGRGQGREWNETGVIFRWRLGKHDHRWRRLNMWKHSLGFFLHLTGRRGGMCGRRGHKPGAPQSWNYSNTSIYFYISSCQIYVYLNIIDISFNSEARAQLHRYQTAMVWGQWVLNYLNTKHPNEKGSGRTKVCWPCRVGISNWLYLWLQISVAVSCLFNSGSAPSCRTCSVLQ